MIDILTEGDLQKLDRAILDLLSGVGMMYQSDRILNALKRKGAKLDASGVARLPAEMIREMVEEQKKRLWQPERVAHPKAAGDYKIGVGLHIAHFYHDPDQQERRRPTQEDFIEIVHFGDVFDESLDVSHALLVEGVPPKVEPLEALLILLEHTRRPGYVYPHYGEQFPYLAEIGEIVASDPHRFLTGGIFIVSPLRMDRRAADFLLKKLEYGLPCSVGSQPVAGVSSPVTAAGNVVSAAAEILGGWAAVRALDPDAPLSGGVCSGILDMRTGDVSFCAPEAMLQDLALVELFRRQYGGHVGVAGGPDYTDAKVPGLQAAFEKTFEAMAISAYTGRYARMGSGLLESGKTFSPIQFLLDKELGGALWKFSKGIEVDEETLALDALKEIGVGVGRCHLETAHTLKNFRQALWLPAFLDRGVWQGGPIEAAREGTILDRVRDRFKEILSQYRKPEMDEDMLASVREVVGRARRELV